MGIKVKLDLVLVQKGMKLTELSEKTGITIQNLSILKTNKGKAIRFSTLEALCNALNCTPGEILEFDGNVSPEVEE
jgi:putative transcriptional regulator